MVSTTPEERNIERDRFIWLFNNCQTRVGILAQSNQDSERKSVVFEDAVERNPTRPLTDADVKVTVKWSTNSKNNGLAHLTQIDGEPYYRLGIRFERWRRLDPEQKIATLAHELGHTRYHNHEKVFWRFVIDIWTSALNQKSTIDGWFDEPLNWDYATSSLINGVYDSSEPEARSKLMNWVGDQLDYPADWTQILDWGRGIRETTTHWPHDDISRIDATEIELSQTYSDKELIEFYTSLETTQNITKIPVVCGTRNTNGSIEITENEIIAALLRRIQSDPTVPVVLENTIGGGAGHTQN